MQTLNRKPTQDEAFKIQAHYRQHPEFFFKHFLGINAWSKQLEIAESVRDNRVTTVRSCHAAGKSYIAACIALWYVSAHPASIVVTTAPTWRQVKDILWRNISTRYAQAKIPLGGDAPNMTGWQVSTNWYAIGVSSKDPDKVQGYHADSGHLLVICDEAAGIDEAIFEGIENVLTGEKCRKLEIGNPTSNAGTFRDNHKPSSNAHRIKISAFDTPNFTANGIRNEDDLVEAIKSKRQLIIVSDNLIGPTWVYERLKKWGPNNPTYKARVLAEFPNVGEKNLIPLDRIEAACTDERLEKILGLKLYHPDILQVGEAKFEQIEAENDRIRQEKLAEYIANQNTVRGVDVARFGGDSTAITPRWGKVIGRQIAYHKEDTMQTAGRIWPMITNLPTDLTAIDVIGVGGGVVDRLRELQAEQQALGKHQWAQIVGVNVADKPTEKPEGLPMMDYANKRAELYWKLANMFETGDIYLMPDEDGNPPEDLMAELSAIEYKPLGSKMYIEEKAEMKKRLNGKSPDHADSLMLTLTKNDATTWEPEETVMEPEDDADWEPPAHHGDDEAGVSAWDGDDEYIGSF
jgi:hypothetical protein